MKIVIDIPEDVYEEIITHNRELRESGKSSYYLEGLIQNGTPLPKGYGDLIDRDKFKSLMDEYFMDTSMLHYDDLTNAEHFNLGIANCFNEIDEMKPVIPADK